MSTNPILAVCCLGIVLAWRIAGWYGLDRWLLPALGTPWTRPIRPPRPQREDEVAPPAGAATS